MVSCIFSFSLSFTPHFEVFLISQNFHFGRFFRGTKIHLAESVLVSFFRLYTAPVRQPFRHKIPLPPAPHSRSHSRFLLFVCELLFVFVHYAFQRVCVVFSLASINLRVLFIQPFLIYCAENNHAYNSLAMASFTCTIYPAAPPLPLHSVCGVIARPSLYSGFLADATKPIISKPLPEDQTSNTVPFQEFASLLCYVKLALLLFILVCLNWALLSRLCVRLLA